MASPTIPAEVEAMMHSLEQRYVKLRDEHARVKAHRDELVVKERTLEDQLAEEQRQTRTVSRQRRRFKYLGDLLTFQISWDILSR